MNSKEKNRRLRYSNRIRIGSICCALLASALMSAPVIAEDGFWINSNGGSWANSANWDPIDGIAGGADNIAYFGFSREASVSAGASYTLDGAQTIGNLVFTTQSGPATWSFTAGSGGLLTLDSTFGLPEINITSPSLTVNLNVVVAGGTGVQKTGPGTLLLSAKNTYSGQTLVSGGGLDVDGSIGTGGLQVANSTLGGTGVINGPVTIGSGGNLLLGNSSGPLTINNSLALLPGSTTSVTINSGNSSALVQGLTSVSLGGTLVINNLSGRLSAGQSFSIFGSVPATGNFSQILPPPGPWLRWEMDPATGQVTVVSSASQPSISSANLSGNNLVFEVTSGPPGSTGYVLASSDVSVPISNWTRVATNTFDMSGSFVGTHAMSADGPGQIYLAVLVVASP